MRFEKELLQTLGAREVYSQRAEQFKQLLWDASAYLVPGSLVDEETIARSEENRELIPDNSLIYAEDNSESIWTREEHPDDWIPW